MWPFATRLLWCLGALLCLVRVVWMTVAANPIFSLLKETSTGKAALSNWLFNLCCCFLNDLWLFPHASLWLARCRLFTALPGRASTDPSRPGKRKRDTHRQEVWLKEQGKLCSWDKELRGKVAVSPAEQWTQKSQMALEGPRCHPGANLTPQSDFCVGSPLLSQCHGVSYHRPVPRYQSVAWKKNSPEKEFFESVLTFFLHKLAASAVFKHKTEKRQKNGETKQKTKELRQLRIHQCSSKGCDRPFSQCQLLRKTSFIPDDGSHIH